MSLSDLFLTYPGLFLTVITMLGLVVGSFLNVVIYRLPIILKRQWTTECKQWLELDDNPETDAHEPFNLVIPRSRCPECGHQITPLENIPILSYLMLRGKCSQCQKPISIQYPLVEIITGLLSLVVAWYLGYSWQTAAVLLLTWGLIALSVIDLQTKLLPDTITIPLLWLGLLLNTGGLLTDLSSSVLGAVVGYLSLWLIYHIFKILTRKEGMGYGDFKLFAVFGAWLGWQSLLFIIIVSSLVGAVVGISLMILKGRDRNIPIPFGPYIAVAGWISTLWGPQIRQAYFAFAL